MSETSKALISFATCWGPQFGGINSFNTDLMTAVSAAAGNELRAFCIVLEADDAEVAAAKDQGVTLLSLNRPSSSEFTTDLQKSVIDALSNAGVELAPDQTVWLGHDRITGAIAISVARSLGGKAALIHHMSYAHYEAYTEHSSSADQKVRSQRKLFSEADVVLAIGPLLRDALCDMLDEQNIKMLVPGLAEITPRTTSPKTFVAFLSGRLNENSKKLKQSYLGVAAFARSIKECSENTGLPDALRRSNEPRLILRGVDSEGTNGADLDAERDLKDYAECHAGGAFTLHTLPFTLDRSDLFDDLRNASVALMPSWHEGFGLVAWEAIAAGVPLIVSVKSGVYKLLSDFEDGLYKGFVTSVDILGSGSDPWFKDNDLRTLSTALIQIAKNPPEYRAKALRLRDDLRRHFSWENCAVNLLSTVGLKNHTPDVIAEGGSMPVMDRHEAQTSITEDQLTSIRTTFASISGIGRSWHREIAGRRLTNPAVKTILKSLVDGTKSILVTGAPGSGKTCVLLAVQDELERYAANDANILPLFLQTSEFADCINDDDRNARGLPTTWVDDAIHASKHAQVIVVIDSLDVLAIAREHSVLKYFLTQLDRLKESKSVSVITACRAFDRQYDRRLAATNWDLEISSSVLNWESEVSPLLIDIGINVESIDATTRKLIQNARELDLFVELATRGETLNAVSSLSLTQLYIDRIVSSLSESSEAQELLEDLADEMLHTRSLAVVRDRYSANPLVLRKLQSQNILRITYDGKLTFGHQTLLDALVVTRAIRLGSTLSAFITNLSPVPFVRPSIRAFVSQLAIGPRDQLRSQIRCVFFSDIAFHIRRLIAESFSELQACDDDWPMIKELREQRRDVFQVIYGNATDVSWHRFWLKYLVPAIHVEQDVEGLATHVHRISNWANDEPEVAITVWEESLELPWADPLRFVNSISHGIAHIRIEDISRLEPLLKKLVSLPRREHTFLGNAVGKYVRGSGGGGELLWQYISGGIVPEDVVGYDFSEKLRCGPYEFGDDNFPLVEEKLKQSTQFLDLVINSIIKWQHQKATHFGEGRRSFWFSFLRDSSYSDAHTIVEHRHVSNLRVLLDGIEAAILSHCENDSDWWHINHRSLCFSDEAVLRFFALTACTKHPNKNLIAVEQMLCDQSLLESDLIFEVGNLLKAAFELLPAKSQDSVITAVLNVHSELSNDTQYAAYIRNQRASLISAIPGYLRSQEAQSLLERHESESGGLIREPEIQLRGGVVAPPFTSEIFLKLSDSAVLNLLAYYEDIPRGTNVDMLIGGTSEVAGQLREAASIEPFRFINLLDLHWDCVAESFRNQILEGASLHIEYRFGNLQPPPKWDPAPLDAIKLCSDMLNLIERHPNYWLRNRATAHALMSCALCITSTQDAFRIVFNLIGFETLREKATVAGDSVDLFTIGINLIRGNVVEALFNLTKRLRSIGEPYPELLTPTILRFAGDTELAIRAVILQRLPSLLRADPKLGWAIFEKATQDQGGLWKSAEACLYHNYNEQSVQVLNVLNKIRLEGTQEDLEVWARISALAALSEKCDFRIFLDELKDLSSTAAWNGAVNVWTHPKNLISHSSQCLAGIQAGLNAQSRFAVLTAKQMTRIFADDSSITIIPVTLVNQCLELLDQYDPKKRHRLFGVEGWLNAVAQFDSEYALSILELYLRFVKQTQQYLFDHGNKLPQLLTKLFSEAEVKESYDRGEMLKRVVIAQDLLLALGASGVEKWLEAAERP